MTWRYILIQKEKDGTPWVELHEVYYTDDGVSRTKEPILVANDETDMLETLLMMRTEIRKRGVEPDPVPGDEE